eukprot:1352051-Rhodomonas_salina.2
MCPHIWTPRCRIVNTVTSPSKRMQDSDGQSKDAADRTNAHATHSRLAVSREAGDAREARQTRKRNGDEEC